MSAVIFINDRDIRAIFFPIPSVAFTVLASHRFTAFVGRTRENFSPSAHSGPQSIPIDTHENLLALLINCAEVFKASGLSSESAAADRPQARRKRAKTPGGKT